MRQWTVLACVVAGLTMLGPIPRLKADEEVDTVALYKKSVDSVAFIAAPVKGGFAMGSGTLIDKTKRYVLTNAHVVDDAEKIYVQFPVHQKDGAIVTDKKKYVDRISTGEAIKGKLLYRDETRDLAIIQVDRVPDTAKEMPLAKGSPSVGEATWSICSPGAVSQVFSFTESRVRAVGKEDLRVGIGDELYHVKCRMVTATHAIGPGDSGGPLFNKQGELVAVMEVGNTRALLVNLFIDVTEVRAFRTDLDDWLKDPIKVVYKQAVDSVLFITIPDKDKPRSASGTLVDVKNRYVLTANHALGTVDEVQVQFPIRGKDGPIETSAKPYLDAAAAGRAISGRVLHRDPKRDLAVVQLEQLPPTARPIRLSKASPEVGTEEWTFGSSSTGANRMFGANAGKVRAVGTEELVVEGGEKGIRIKCKVVTVTSPVNQTDIGGPVVNRFGEMIAMTEEGMINSFMDVTELRAFLADIKARKAEPKAK